MRRAILTLDSRPNFRFYIGPNIRPGIDCMLENMPPSLINETHVVRELFGLSSYSKHVPKTAVFFGYRSIKIFVVEYRGQGRW